MSLQSRGIRIGICDACQCPSPNYSSAMTPLQPGLVYGPVNGLVYCPIHGAQFKPAKSAPPPQKVKEPNGFTSREDLVDLDTPPEPEYPPFQVDNRIDPNTDKLRFIKRRPSLKERVYRDPITGIGDFGDEHDPIRNGNSTPRTHTRRSALRDPIAGNGDLGEINPWRRRPNSAQTNGDSTEETNGHNQINGVDRNPISGCGDLGPQYDAMRRSGPVATSPRGISSFKVQRDVITGRGDFSGEDKSSTSRGRQSRTPRRDQSPNRNPITGSGVDDCDPFWPYGRPAEVARMRSKSCEPPVSSLALIGNPEPTVYGLRRTPTTEDVRVLSNNPITGDRCSTYEFTKPEFRPRSAGNTGRTARESTNPLTGSNCNSYDVNREARPRSRRSLQGLSNPLTGNNCRYYDVNIETKPRTPRCYQETF